MPTAKLCTIGSSDAMKSDGGNDSLDTFIRQAARKDPLLSGDNPVQWVQFLHALDQPDLPSWPLITPLKVQMQKCEKCSGEFFSPVNYRRHMRMHRRSLNFDKESHKYRDLLGAFWDKLSLEEAKEVASLSDISLKEIPGTLLVKTLTESLHKSGAWVWSLPSVYVKAGSTLLDIIEAKPSRLPVSSQELFSVLDDASERTFLCAGTAESLQKYIFNDEVAKVCLELKNLVACTCFLFEQKLVKAWIAYKEAEALRCQKLLVEEEEAAQRRQTELLEKKRQKKLRQKEQKARDQISEEKVDLSGTADSSGSPLVAEISSPPPLFDSYSSTLDVAEDVSYLEMIHLEKNDEEIEAFDLDTIQNTEPEQKQDTFREWGTEFSNTKTWTKEDKMQNDKSFWCMYQKEATKIQNNCEVMIGSISVPVKNCTTHIQGTNLAKTQDHSGNTQPKMPKENNFSEMQNRSDLTLGSIMRVASKHWVPVIKHGKGPKGRQDNEKGALVKVGDQNLSSADRLQSYAEENAIDKSHSLQLPDCNTHSKGLLFSNGTAKTFLTKRWNEVVSADHVKLVICPVPKPQESPSTKNNNPKSAPPSAVKEHGILTTKSGV